MQVLIFHCKIVGCLKLKITVWRYLKLCNNKLKDEKKKKGYYNGVLFQGEEKCHFVFCVYFSLYKITIQLVLLFS